MAQKTPKNTENPKNTKRPETNVDPDAYLTKNPIWAFCRCDFAYERWSIKRCQSIFENIIKKLSDYEGMTWAEIQSSSGGRKKGTNNHFENISDMSRDAQKRANEIHLDADQLFSLRLTGEKRLYGVLDRGIFFAIWYDEEHEIYPVKK